MEQVQMQGNFAQEKRAITSAEQELALLRPMLKQELRPWHLSISLW